MHLMGYDERLTNNEGVHKKFSTILAEIWFSQLGQFRGKYMENRPLTDEELCYHCVTY